MSTDPGASRPGAEIANGTSVDSGYGSRLPTSRCSPSMRPLSDMKMAIVLSRSPCAAIASRICATSWSTVRSILISPSQIRVSNSVASAWRRTTGYIPGAGLPTAGPIFGAGTGAFATAGSGV